MSGLYGSLMTHSISLPPLLELGSEKQKEVGRPGEGTGTVGMALLPPSGPNPSRPGQAVASCFAQVQLWSHARREVVAKLSMGPPFWKAPSCKRHCEALGFRLP